MTELSREDIDTIKGYRFTVSNEEYDRVMEMARDEQPAAPRQTTEELGALANIASKHSSDTDADSR